MNKTFFFDNLSGADFELYLKSVFESSGYKVSLTPASNNYGADLILFKENAKIVVRAKRYAKQLGISAVQEIIGAVSYYKATSGMVITNNYFTPNAISLAKTADIKLWDRDELIQILLIRTTLIIYILYPMIYQVIYH